MQRNQPNLAAVLRIQPDIAFYWATTGLCIALCFWNCLNLFHLHQVLEVSFNLDPPTFVAMSLIDSEAAFDSRCDKLEAGLKDLFHAQSINTFSSLAFAVGTPKESVNDADMKAFRDKIFTREATIGEGAYVKRLHFEASTVVMADLKAQATFGDTTEPSRKIPFVEKQRRLTEQEGRITGFSHRNEQQPSHALIDACFTIVETGALIYLPPSKCGSRDAEIHTDSKNKQKQILTLEQGTLKSVHHNSLTQVDVGTELKLMFAFQRRASPSAW